MNRRQPSTNVVEGVLEEADAGSARVLMSAINVGEVYYFVRKQYSEAAAEQWRQLSAALPITIEVPTRDEIWDAALLKGKYPISYADAFAAALALKYRCPLLTGDPDFRRVANLELDWIGPTTA
jgi:ribonuclease VapC